MARSTVLLPEPLSPTRPKAEPSGDPEADPVDGAHGLRVLAERDRQALDPDHGPASSQAGSRFSTCSRCCGRSSRGRQPRSPRV